MLASLEFAPVLLLTKISPTTSSFSAGLVIPMPTLPPFVIIKLVAVEEPTTNEGTPAPRPLGLTDNSPHGEVEAMPRRFAESSQKRFELSWATAVVPQKRIEPSVK